MSYARQYYADKAIPSEDHIEGFFEGLIHSLKILEDRLDCKTARKVINQERMTLRLHQEINHG